MLFREHLYARFWCGLGLQSCWGSGVSQPCPTVLHRAFPWYWPVHPDIYGFAFYALHCLLFNGPKILFREHLCAGFWHRTALGCNLAGLPLFRNHAPQPSTRPVRPISNQCRQASVHPCIYCLCFYLFRRCRFGTLFAMQWPLPWA